MNAVYTNARSFIYRNARPLDIARWQHHFECGPKEAVLTALAAYQNEDGGFGHALEPDAWNPHSSPIQTWEATEILREIGFADPTHPLVQGIVAYLAGGDHFNGHTWQTVIQSNNDYPHAPWWHANGDSACHNDYNPTASLAGFLARFADKGSKGHCLGCRIVQEATAALLQDSRENDMHTLRCYINLMEDCIAADIHDLFDMRSLKNKLIQSVNRSITRDTAQWEANYICKPSQFFHSKESIFYDDNKEIAQYECHFIQSTQQPDGAWPIPWNWTENAEAWAISKNWWKANGAIENMLFLRRIDTL